MVNHLWIARVISLAFCLGLLAGCGQPSPSPVMPTDTLSAPSPSPIKPTETIHVTNTIESSPTPTKATSTATPRPTAVATKQSKPPFGNPFVVYTAWDGQELQINAAKLDEDPVKSYVLTQEENMAYMPVWSPDGTKIAYILYDRSSQQSYFKLHDIQKEETIQLSTQEVNIIGTYCWTFDQKYLIWGDHQPGGEEMDIYRLELATGKIIDLTQESTVWDAFPVCSPVSDQIAFVSDRKGSGKELDNVWVMDSQGENLKQITNAPTWENTYPGWSPDGSEIVFIRGASFTSEDKYGPPGLWAVKADGSGERIVIELDTPLAANSTTPVWSPDGKYIAYSSGNDETSIYIITASGGEPVWSSDLPGTNHEISWSASSEYLIFTNTQNDRSRIYIIAIDAPKPEPMLPNPDNFLAMFGPGKK